VDKENFVMFSNWYGSKTRSVFMVYGLPMISTEKMGSELDIGQSAKPLFRLFVRGFWQL
jgi:hypothetical protein